MLSTCKPLNKKRRFIMIGRIYILYKEQNIHDSTFFSFGKLHDSTLIKVINNHENKTIVVDDMMMCYLWREEEGIH